jgi:hypothetical protein
MLKDLKHRNCHLLLGYWAGLQRDQVISQETQHDALVLRILLPTIGIVRMDHESGPAIYSVVGHAHSQRIRARSGQGVGEGWLPESALRLQLFFQESLRLGSPFYWHSIASDYAQCWHSFETLWVPLKSAGGSTSFVGVCESLDNGPICPPIAGLQKLLAISDLHQLEAVQSPGAPSTPALTRGHLRLVSG